MDNIKPLLDTLRFRPTHAVECGAAHPSTSQLRDYIRDGVKCELFEPNPRLFYCLFHGFDLGDFQASWPLTSAYPHQHEGFGHLKNVRLYNVALGDSTGYAKMYECNASSFIQGVESPAKANDHVVEDTVKNYMVRVAPFSAYDDGTIDLLVADTEGSEWFILKYLVSRPSLISLETHGGSYVNPYMKEINAWMEENKYLKITATTSDTIWGLASRMIRG
jgi:hypothetical protein